MIKVNMHHPLVKPSKSYTKISQSYTPSSQKRAYKANDNTKKSS